MSAITDTQYGNPILCTNDGSKEFPLQRIELEKGSDFTYDENWLQELIHRNPALLPVDEIDPIFTNLGDTGLNSVNLQGVDRACAESTRSYALSGFHSEEETQSKEDDIRPVNTRVHSHSCDYP